MLFVLIVLLIIIFKDAKLYQKDEYNVSYMSKINTTAINGLFVLIVILRHYTGYTTFKGIYDEPFIFLNNILSQLLVVTFLFYSGYGMMEQIKAKGYDYVKKIKTKWLKLFIKFDIAVLLFLILGLVLGNHFKISNVLLAFTGWEGIGNSNWYIFDILWMYILMFISFLLIKNKNSKINKYISSIILLILTILFVFTLMKLGKDSYWYNTVIMFPLGVIYSLVKDKVDKIVMKSDITYLLSLFITICLFFLSFKYRFSFGIEIYTIWVILFMMLVLLITMKISIDNKWLIWLGTHVFSIYILQRLSMIVLNYFGYTNSHRYISLIIVFVTTCLIATVFDKYTDKLLNLKLKKH